jgi:hypothetical protein
MRSYKTCALNKILLDDQIYEDEWAKYTWRIHRKCYSENLTGREIFECVGIGKMIILKGKGKLSLCLTKHHAMKAYWGVEV